MRSKYIVGLIFLSALFGILLNAPILQIPTGTLYGVPTIFYYILFVWVLLIAVMAVLARNNTNSDS
jgi:hypothetical protein